MSDAGLSVKDVENLYRLFLGRDPETEGVSRSQAERPSAELIQSLLMSDEFRRERDNLVKGGVAGGGRFATPPSPEMVEWVATALPCSDDGRRLLLDARTWRDIYTALLPDPDFIRLLSSEVAASVNQLARALLIRNEDLGEPPNTRTVALPASPLRSAAPNFVAEPLSASSGAPIQSRLAVQVEYWRVAAPERLETALSGLSAERLAGAPNVKGRLPFKDVRADALLSDVFFDAFEYYLENPAVLASQMSALEHFRLAGDKQGLRASARFDSSAYLQLYPSVGEEGWGPLDHWMTFGVAEGRPLPPSGDLNRLATRDRLQAYLEGALARDSDLGPRPLDAAQAWFLDFRWSSLKAAALNSAWGGAAALPKSLRFAVIDVPRSRESQLGYAAETSWILSRHFAKSEPVHSTLILDPGPLKQSRPDRRPSTEDVARGGLSLITPFYAHLEYFRTCAESVELARRVLEQVQPGAKFEWVVVNDDLRIPSADVLAQTPESLRPFIVLADHQPGGGISAASNDGIARATGQWLAFLDCDDAITPDSLVVLQHYSTLGYRCMSSGIVDIDENSVPLRFRRHPAPPSQQLRDGLLAGHMKCVHRSLFDEFGLLEQSADGVQDYDFSLRLPYDEILLMPDYLYMYRWHSGTQSTSRVARQSARSEAARKTVLNRRFCRTIEPSLDVEPGKAVPAPGSVRCIIRTRGGRPGTLVEAVESVFEAHKALSPLVVVHAGAAKQGLVEAILGAAFGPETVEVLGAPNAQKSRGYPLNVGMEVALRGGAQAVCFLDDDDVLLPPFGSHLLTKLFEAGAGVAYGRTVMRTADGVLENGPPLAPPIMLTRENFIPTNALVVSREALLAVQAARGIWFSEDMYYLEDWSFLQALLAAKVRWAAIDACVGEFRLGSDGNAPVKKSPNEFVRCQSVCAYQAAQILEDFTPEEVRRYADLPQALYSRLPGDQLNLMKETLREHG